MLESPSHSTSAPDSRWGSSPALPQSAGERVYDGTSTRGTSHLHSCSRLSRLLLSLPARPPVYSRLLEERIVFLNGPVRVDLFGRSSTKQSLNGV